MEVYSGEGNEGVKIEGASGCEVAEGDESFGGVCAGSNGEPE